MENKNYSLIYHNIPLKKFVTILSRVTVSKVIHESSIQAAEIMYLNLVEGI
jgi:hypothetical protein